MAESIQPMNAASRLKVHLTIGNIFAQFARKLNRRFARIRRAKELSVISTHDISRAAKENHATVTRRKSVRLLTKGRMARPERFELPTSWFVAMRSIQLSYGRTLIWPTTFQSPIHSPRP